MKATARLYLTSGLTALVAAGDPRAATLYAVPGDEIPDSAVEKFGLVDGDIADREALVASDFYNDAILRVASGDPAAPPIEVAGFTFAADWQAFAKGAIDIEQLLAIVQHPGLKVEALQFVNDEAHQWGPIPGLAFFLPVLERQVAAAQTLGMPMPRIGEEVADEIASLAHPAAVIAAGEEPGLPVDPTPSIDDVPPPPPPVTSATPATQEPPVKEAETPTENKEKAPAQDKEKKGGANKGGHQPSPSKGGSGPGTPPRQGGSGTKA